MNNDPVYNLLSRLCFAFLKYKDDFAVVAGFSGETLSRWSIRVNLADFPRVNGKQGARFDALRTLVAVAGKKAGRRIQLTQIDEPIKGERELYPKFKYSPNWPREDIHALLNETLEAVLWNPFKVEVREALGSCIYVVHRDERENAQQALLLLGAIGQVFEVIGTTHGCRITVDFSTNK